MELTKATLKDIDQLTEMNIQLREDEKMDNVMSHDEVFIRMKNFLKSKDYLVFILKKNNENLGYVLININRNPVYLRQLFIKREFRKRGYGSFIINEILIKLNINELDLEVMSWNQSAIDFYENFGFKKRYLGMRYKK